MEKCKNCEKAAILQIAELTIENDRLKNWERLLNKGLDIAQELNQALREENEELKNKIRILKND